jgi:hypothetical protein
MAHKASLPLFPSFAKSTADVFESSGQARSSFEAESKSQYAEDHALYQPRRELLDERVKKIVIFGSHWFCFGSRLKSTTRHTLATRSASYSAQTDAVLIPQSGQL